MVGEVVAALQQLLQARCRARRQRCAGELRLGAVHRRARLRGEASIRSSSAAGTLIPVDGPDAWISVLERPRSSRTGSRGSRPRTCRAGTCHGAAGSRSGRSQRDHDGRPIVADIEVEQEDGARSGYATCGAAEQAGLPFPPRRPQPDDRLPRTAPAAPCAKASVRHQADHEPRLGRLSDDPVQGRAAHARRDRPAHRSAADRLGRTDARSPSGSAIANAFFDAQAFASANRR